MSVLQENIPDNTIKDFYLQAFKKNKITVKEFKITHDRKEKKDYFHIILLFDIHFWVEWSHSPHMVRLLSVVNEKESPMKTMYEPTAETLIDSIKESYKKLIKRKSLMTKILSLILEDKKT